MINKLAQNLRISMTLIIQYKYMKKNTSCKLKNVDSKSAEYENKKIKEICLTQNSSMYM